MKLFNFCLISLIASSMLAGCASTRRTVIAPEDMVQPDAIASVSCADTGSVDCLVTEQYINALGEKCSIFMMGAEKNTYCRNADGVVRKLKKISD